MLSLQRRQAVGALNKLKIMPQAYAPLMPLLLRVYAGMPACIHHCVPSTEGLWAWQARSSKEGQEHTNTDNIERRGTTAVSDSAAVCRHMLALKSAAPWQIRQASALLV
jgi:hypothetical protein